MDAATDYQSNWNKLERERQIPYDVTYMWNWKYDPNEPIYGTETLTQRRDCWLPRRGEGIEGGASRWKLLYSEGIRDKVLLYSTENHAQHPMRNHKEKNILKECVCIYIYMYNWITVVCKSTIHQYKKLKLNKIEGKIAYKHMCIWVHTSIKFLWVIFIS